jgi:hypothetical protein
MGGPCGYGYRRRMISGDGKLKQILKKGQQKNIKTDRIILVLGPRKEVETIRLIFSMAAEGSNCTDIVRELNRRQSLIHGREWNDVTVLHILTNPKYTGANMWHRHTQRLHSSLRVVEPHLWIGKSRAFPPIVDQQTFDRAQATIQKMRDSRWSAEKVLSRIRRLLKTKGRLSERIILDAQGAPSMGTICKYFGSHRHLYEVIDYKPENFHVERLEQMRRSMCLRRKLCDQIAALFPDNVEIFTSFRGGRSLLRIDNTFLVSVLFCRSETPNHRLRRPQAFNVVGRPFVTGPCWGAQPPIAEREYITLICLLSKKFDRILSFYVVDKMGDRAYIRLRRNGQFLQQATKLKTLSEFYKTVVLVLQQAKTVRELRP